MGHKAKATGLAAALGIVLFVTLRDGHVEAKLAGYAAYDARDFEAAVTHLDEALAERDSSAPDYLDVAIARCLALAWVGEGMHAKTALLEIAEHRELTLEDYTIVVSDLCAAEHWDAALEILEIATEKFPDDWDVESMQWRVQKAWAARGGPAPPMPRGLRFGNV